MRLKEHLDMWAAIFTIILSLIALKGSFHLYQSGLLHKMGHLISYYHDKTFIDNYADKI